MGHTRGGSRTGAGAAGALAVLAFAGGAAGQPAAMVARADRHEGTVVRVEGADGEIFADVGHATGVETGSRYRVFRLLTVRHPVTGQVLRDRYPIGTATVTAAGDHLSLVHADALLARPPQVGDVLVPVLTVTAPPPAAEVPQERPAPVPVASVVATPPARLPATAAASEAPAPVVAAGVDPTERAVLGVWLATLGRDPTQRLALYRVYLQAHPDSPFAPAVQREIEAFQWIVRSLASRPAESSPTRPAEARSAETVPLTGPVLRGAPADPIQADDPAVVAFQLDARSPVRAGMLHVRRRGEPAYRSLAMEVQGDGFLRARIPPGVLAPPGYDYFVEVIDPDGRALPVIGTAASPRAVEVVPPPAPPGRVAGLTRVDLRAEFADVGSRVDTAGVVHLQRFGLVEGDFLLRLGRGVVYGYRVGFGVYDVVGEALSDLARGAPAGHATVIYGYHELEFAPSDFVHVMGRIEVGVHGGGLGLGVQGRVRVGYERATNIVVGGDVLQEVGQRAFFTFNFHPLAALPAMAQGEVFNQSIALGDPMFRFIAQVGYRVAPWAVIAARGSYQLRNIDNGGFGGGLSLTFDW